MSRLAYMLFRCVLADVVLLLLGGSCEAAPHLRDGILYCGDRPRGARFAKYGGIPNNMYKAATRETIQPRDRQQ